MTRNYGPHDPDTAPAVVKVLGPGKYPRAYETDVPWPIQEQRAQVNNRAWEAGLTTEKPEG